jgi:hypothetical protein
VSRTVCCNRSKKMSTHGREPPGSKSIRHLFIWFKETGCLLKQESPGRQGITEEDVVRMCMVCPRKSMSHSICSMVQGYSEPRSKMCCNKGWHYMHTQFDCNMKSATDRPKTIQCVNFISEETDFVRRLLLTNCASFHVKGHVNRHTCRIVGTG